MVFADEVIAVLVLEELEITSDVGVIELTDETQAFEVVAEVGHLGFWDLLDGALDAGLLVDCQAGLAVEGVADHAADVVVVVRALTVLAEDHLV